MSSSASKVSLVELICLLADLKEARTDELCPNLPTHQLKIELEELPCAFQDGPSTVIRHMCAK